jgi:hypothetical protein
MFSSGMISGGDSPKLSIIILLFILMFLTY